MPTTNQRVGPSRAAPVNARHLRLLRRRTRLEWIWFGLAVAAVAVVYSIAATIQFHARQVAATEAERNAVERHGSGGPADSNLSASSSASVTPLRSIMSLADLGRWQDDAGEESEHFFPSLDIVDELGSNEPSRAGPNRPDAIKADQSDNAGSADLDTVVLQPEPTTSANVERNGIVPGRPRAEQPLRYDLLLPSSGPRGAPMLVLLHGAGGVRAVWNRWAAAAQARGYIVCLPVASGIPAADSKSAVRDSRKRWSNVDVPKLRNLARQLTESLRADERRVYVFGHSNGAFYAQEAGLRNPDVFSAIVSIGGGCNVREISEEAKQVGVYMIHGASDRAVPVEVARTSAERLRNAGVSNVVLKEYPERGHELFEDEMEAVFDWIENLGF
jgi:dienelactone hydrolase